MVISYDSRFVMKMSVKIHDPAGVTLSSPVQPPGTSQQIAVGAAPAARQLLPRGEEPVCSSGNDLASDFASIQSHSMWLSQNWS